MLGAGKSMKSQALGSGLQALGRDDGRMRGKDHIGAARQPRPAALRDGGNVSLLTELAETFGWIVAAKMAALRAFRVWDLGSGVWVSGKGSRRMTPLQSCGRLGGAVVLGLRSQARFSPGFHIVGFQPGLEEASKVRCPESKAGGRAGGQRQLLFSSRCLIAGCYQGFSPL